MTWVGGCASGARVVRADAHGGELEAWGPVVPATAHVRELLVEHCQGRFTVAEAPVLKRDAAAVRMAFRCNAPQPTLTPAQAAEGQAAVLIAGRAP